MGRNRQIGTSTAPRDGSFGSLYSARRAMMATIRERLPEARFFDALTLQRKAPNEYATLTDIASRHHRSIAECIFYESAEGVSVAFLLTERAP